MADSSRRLGACCAIAGALLLGASVACSDGAASEANVQRSAAATVPAAGSIAASSAADGRTGTEPGKPDSAAARVGRSFTDTSPVPERPDLDTSTLPVKAGGAKSANPVGIAGLRDGLDPSMLTPEALAVNPLTIGVEKRAPFQLAEGADPLDAASYDWEKDEDGHWIISFSDLSLTAVDKETLLDALVYPDEYEGEDIQFPDRIRALDGEKVALTGYMIAMRWNKNKLQHFMLVRDLKSCCFGQQPEADEWVDVPMDGPGTSYIQFVPVVTRGVFHLAGSSDDAGYAVGAFKIEGQDTREE